MQSIKTKKNFFFKKKMSFFEKKNNYREKIQNAIVYNLDTKTAKRFYRLFKKHGNGTDNLDFDYHNVYSACYVLYFLQLRQLPIPETVKNFEKICVYSKKDMIDTVTKYKMKDIKNRIFHSVKDNFYWFMTFDCMISNVWPSKEFELIKKLSLASKIKFLMFGLEEIVKQIKTTKTSEDKEDNDDKFEQNLATQSAILQHRNFIHSLQILAQKLYYSIPVETLEYIVYHPEYNSVKFDELCLDAGLPWLCRRFVDHKINSKTICSERKYIPKTWNGHKWLKLIDSMCFSTRNMFYPTFFGKEHVMENWKRYLWVYEELCFYDKIENYIMTNLQFINHTWLLKNMPEDFEIVDFEEDDKTILGLCRLFDTGLYKKMKTIPFSWVKYWYEQTGNVILDPDFLNKVDDNKKLDSLWKENIVYICFNNNIDTSNTTVPS
jgi:hypothetical protein